MELVYRVKKPETIKRFMTENNIPTSILEKDEKNYRIFVNNEVKARKDTVRKGDRIHFHLRDEGLNKNIKPEPFDLEILFEDECLLIVNKPENMAMAATKANPSNSLANKVVGYYQKINHNNLVHFINKLDRESSGVIVIAKHRFIKFLLSEKVDNAIEFSYKALVEGKLDVKEFEICLPIKKQEDSYIREVAESGGEECTTKYRVEKEFKNYSLLDIEIIGKIPYQIRVHLSFFDKPLVGDKIYNKTQYNTPLLLSCYKTEFIHPIYETKIKVEIPLPKYFIDFMQNN